VNYVLAKRLELLEVVGRLQRTLDAGADAGATCELAHHFHVYHVRPRWQAFTDTLQRDKVAQPSSLSYLFSES
jgi:intron-binding protein aquarius